MTNQRGFTLIELLIAIGAIGLLMVIGVIVLGTARERARDATRLADLAYIRGALEQHYYNNNKYPAAPTPVPLGTQGYRVICAGTSNGFADTPAQCTGTVYADRVNPPPEPQPEAVPGYFYSSPGPTTYLIETALEGAVEGLKGKIEISPAGILPRAQ